MPTPAEVPAISALTLRFFRRIVRSYFRRHFRSVMMRGGHTAERLQQAGGPLIIYANHSSWWDPMIQVLLGQLVFPGRRHYAPIDAAALRRYPILRRLGIFPVETGSTRGAAQFLRTAKAILSDGGVLWVTPQGRFADPRQQPLAFRPGLAALAARLPNVPLLPLAIEYTFWDERLPEALVEFGEPPLPAAAADRLDAAAATHVLESALATTMASLQTASIAREEACFQPLLAGRRGAGGFYSLWPRFKAWLTRHPEALDHGRRGHRS